jgi:hypothetical protein
MLMFLLLFRNKCTETYAKEGVLLSYVKHSSLLFRNKDTRTEAVLYADVPSVVPKQMHKHLKSVVLEVNKNINCSLLACCSGTYAQESEDLTSVVPEANNDLNCFWLLLEQRHKQALAC